MLRTANIFILILLNTLVRAQNPCLNLFLTDSLTKPGEKEGVLVNALTAPLKTGGTVQIINHNDRFFLKLKITEKLGFVASGPLELKSGTKSFYVKTAQLNNINKPNANFVIEVFINYVATLRDHGLTGLVFNTHEIKFAKEDTKNIREIAGCFYTEHNKK